MNKRLSNTVIVLIIALFTAVLLSVSLGSTYISLIDIIRVLAGTEKDTIIIKIVWQLRLPRTITALLVGAALSVSGVLMQTFFRNPIVGPSVLGISSGAGLGAAIWIMGSGQLVYWGYLGRGVLYNPWAQVIAASLGAICVLWLILMVAWKVKDMNFLLIVGLMLSSAISAVIMLLQFFSKQEDLQRFIFWGMGDLGTIGWQEIIILLPIVVIGITCSLLLIQPLNVLLLGEDYARSMGVNINVLRWQLILITAFLAGSVTAFCGPIVFVGIAVPHLARILLKSQRLQGLLPVSLLLGMVLLVFCQIIAVLPMQEQILPINIITSILGAPIVLGIVLQMYRIKN